MQFIWTASFSFSNVLLAYGVEKPGKLWYNIMIKHKLDYCVIHSFLKWMRCFIL